MSSCCSSKSEPPKEEVASCCGGGGGRRVDWVLWGSMVVVAAGMIGHFVGSGP